MNPEDLQARIKTSNGHRGEFHRERASHNGLNADRVANTRVGRRVRSGLRHVEDQVLDDISSISGGVKGINRQLGNAARQVAQIDESIHAMVRPESKTAMLDSLHEAEAVVSELNTLRSAALRMIAGLASDLTPADGRSVWTDVPSNTLFPGGTDLFPDPEPDLIDELIGKVDETRGRAARQQSPNIADDELARILGG